MYEKVFVEIGGVRQGMFMQEGGEDKPILLFLHGGPGSPEVTFNHLYPTGLDKYFTVCWWEQRGSGISYDKSMDKSCMSVELLLSDTIEITEYLRDRYGKDKIYLMGHSWGSLLGVLAASHSPHLYHAFVGIGQVVNIAKSEQMGYEYMLDELKKAGSRWRIRRLKKHESVKRGESDFKYLNTIRCSLLNQLGVGYMRNEKAIASLFKELLYFGQYTIREKISYVRGISFSLGALWDDIYNLDLMKLYNKFEIPVYILHGLYDIQVSYSLAKDYADMIEAPVVGFYTFEESAHSPCFEEIPKMCEIIEKDVLKGVATLADK